MSENGNNFNITPDMINNLASILQNTNLFTEQYSNNSNESSNSNNTNNDSNFSTNNSIDFETILKIKSIMETLNQNDDNRSNLLYSLKPYLRESKQKKIDQYVNLFKITKVTNLFKKESGDIK